MYHPLLLALVITALAVPMAAASADEFRLEDGEVIHGRVEARKKGRIHVATARGSWDPLGQYSSSAGRVFITGICTLMLQTPCRYPRR